MDKKAKERAGDGSAQDAAASVGNSEPDGTSPYASGAGGVTFERKVAVQLLTHMLVGTGIGEVTRGRRVVRVAFQQAPSEPVDDIVVTATLPNESKPSLTVALAVRRSPKLVQSDEDSQKLVRQLVEGLGTNSPDGQDHRLGLVVAGAQKPASELAQLAQLAAGQVDASGFFGLVNTHGKFDKAVRHRLQHLRSLVERALKDLRIPVSSQEFADEHSWRLLSNFDVLMPRLEAPDETDWTRVLDSLRTVVPDSDPSLAASLRDRLLALADDYAPQAAIVDLSVLRRATHGLVNDTVPHHAKAWRVLDDIQVRARDSVRSRVTAQDQRSVRLDRSAVASDLHKAVSDAPAVLITGASGVGKSALAVQELASNDAEPNTRQSVVVNLRQLPEVGLTLESVLGVSLSTLLSELNAPQRTLVIDATEPVAEGRDDIFRYLVHAARQSEVKVVAVTADDSKQVVLDVLALHFGRDIVEFEVPSLTDEEIEQLVGTFSELGRLYANRRSRELLRRLVVVDLLVRAGVSGMPLSDAEAMNEIWAGLVRQPSRPGRGLPDARETAMLKLAQLELDGGERLDVVATLNSTALEGLQRDGLLRRSVDDLFKIGPEFAHDELRRYALARLLLANGEPAARLLQADAPRSTLSAACLACQAILALHSETIPVKGRLATQQASFDKIVDAGHGSRWGDVPGEALLGLAEYEELLTDAWPRILADGGTGLRRLARLVDQRLRNSERVIDISAVAPIIRLVLEDPTPWKSGEHVQDLLRDWLQGHALARTNEGQPLRILLRQRLVEVSVAADRRFKADRELARGKERPHSAQSQALAERLHRSSTSLLRLLRRDQTVRRPSDIPRELKEEAVVEFLALLGPDLGDDGEAILQRLAKDAPGFLCPAVDDALAAMALADRSPELLAKLAEAYYLDDDHGFGVLEDGIRRHRYNGIGGPFAAWHRGPFFPLLRTNFRTGVTLLNRLLNHAARVRVRNLANWRAPWHKDAVQLSSEFTLGGQRRRYVGDAHVWCWYRGNAVGPHPCVSALQALERECERLAEGGIPIATIIRVLLDGCENLAMVGLVVGILVRHAEDAHSLLDPFVVEPLIWRFEFIRAAEEASQMTARTEGLPRLDRRKWSLREACMLLVLRAEGERIAELRSLGDTLVKNARRLARGTKRRSDTPSPFSVGPDRGRLVEHARAWATSLDRSSYRTHAEGDSVIVETVPPADVEAALQRDEEQAQATKGAIGLFLKYHVRPSSDGHQPTSPDELVADLYNAKKLLDNPPTDLIHNPLDICALVSAAILNANLVADRSLPDDTLHLAAEVVLQIGEAYSSVQGVEDMFYEYGADRSASRALPLLLLPAASRLRAELDQGDGSATFKRAVEAGINLGQTEPYEVRLHLARGLDDLWKAPCTTGAGCHHEAGLEMVAESIRYCALGQVDQETGTRSAQRVEDPLGETIERLPDDAVMAARLDGAIRALAPAATAGICVSRSARELLCQLLAAQRRSLLSIDYWNPDDRGTHTLVAARALLALAGEGDKEPILQYIDAYADHSPLLDNLLRALSAAAEEAPDRAATAKRIWPTVMRRVLELDDSGRTPFGGQHYGDMALAALVPVATSEIPFLYREVGPSQIVWWEPEALRPEVELWLTRAAGNPTCIIQFIHFLAALALDGQARIGLPWIKELVLGDGSRDVHPTVALPEWLVNVRSAAVDADLQTTWQAIVDALVVAGVTQLAPYSD